MVKTNASKAKYYFSSPVEFNGKLVVAITSKDLYDKRGEYDSSSSASALIKDIPLRRIGDSTFETTRTMDNIELDLALQRKGFKFNPDLTREVERKFIGEDRETKNERIAREASPSQFYFSTPKDTGEGLQVTIVPREPYDREKLYDCDCPEYQGLLEIVADDLGESEDCDFYPLREMNEKQLTKFLLKKGFIHNPELE